MAAPSVVGIWNRALQLCGCSRVQDTNDTSKNGLACVTCYEAVRDRCLEGHPWRFAMKLASLAADSPAPTFGRTNSFTVPADFISLIPDYEEDNSELKDWEMQDGRIFTDDDAPLLVRYVSRVTDVARMIPTFRELVATEMAFAMCEALTQSNPKKDRLEKELVRVWAAARRANSRQGRSQMPPDDPWLRARL